MKKYLFALAALSLLFACTPENNNNGGTKNNEDEVTITGEALNVTDYSATLTGYANLPFELGDAEVGIMYDKQQSFEDARKVVATGLDGNNKFTVSVTGLEPSTTYYFKSYVQNGMAVKYGSVKSFTTSFFSVESVSLDKTEYTFNTIGDTLTLTATVLPADATDKSVSWTSDKEAVATVDANGRVNAKGNGTATITVTTKDQVKTATCIITVAQWVTGITLDKTSLSLVIGAEATLSVASVLPDNANDKTYTWSSSDSAIASVDNSGKVTAKAKGMATITATANDGSGESASCSVVVYRIDIPQVVDMGTVVNGKNIKWASFNIGASSPEEYGLYYAWGETEPKGNYLWSTYKWGTSETSLTKYNTDSSCGPVDNKTVLEPEDDVAYVKLGGKWRMPTAAEWTELIATCTWTWIENYNGTGVAGEIVTASNSNSIFLPAAGSLYGAYLDDAGSIGRYWSSSLRTDIPDDAWSVLFDSGVVRGNLSRCYGRSVRPVKEPYTAVAGEAVDLGLSVKWSSTNLGATSPSDYGDYFAWGETSPKEDYSWATYELCNGSSSTLTKYNNSSSYGAVDNKSEFKDYGYEDDAARQALGGKWRVPTDAEWWELITKCTWTWTESYNGTGVKGRIVTASNGNSIFLPAAGYRGGTDLGGAGSNVDYWSSSLDTDCPYFAWFVYFYSDGVYRYSFGYRYLGRSVRPVSE